MGQIDIGKGEDCMWLSGQIGFIGTPTAFLWISCPWAELAKKPRILPIQWILRIVVSLPGLTSSSSFGAERILGKPLEKQVVQLPAQRLTVRMDGYQSLQPFVVATMVHFRMRIGDNPMKVGNKLTKTVSVQRE